MLAAYVPRETAAALWADAPFIAGVFAPGGKLDDGKLTGRWSYGSGSRHADLVVLGAIANRRHVVCLVKPESVRIVENWDTLGLAGTGSHDLVVEGAVPEHVTSVFDVAPWAAAPLYRMPLFGLLATGIAACGLGIARSALAALRFDDKTPSATLARYAELRAELAAARAYLLATCTAVHDAAAITPVERGELRLAASHVAARCADVVRGAFHLVGGAAIRAGHPVGAALRDVETLLTHKMVVDRVLPAAARAILGIGTPPPDL
jgi:alkylation response protein AidB-like acyl-CoA dehydrogenase